MEAAEFTGVIRALGDHHRGPLEGVDLLVAIADELHPIRDNHGELLVHVRNMAHSPDPAVRAARADALHEVVNGDPDFLPAVLSLLEKLAFDETDARVIASIARALGNLCDVRANRRLLTWTEHVDADVRFNVAAALRGEVDGQIDEAATDALIKLSRDQAPLVRDWATFGLGFIQTRRAEVTEALFARLEDQDPDTRLEAFSALAEQRDERIVEPLIALLGDDGVGTLAVKAADTLADVRFHPVLTWLLGDWPEEAEAIQHAIYRCDPALRTRARDLELAAVAASEQSCGDRGLVGVEITLDGTYPDTDLVIALGDGFTERTPLWGYWDDHPLSLDPDFVAKRVANLAESIQTT